MSRLALPFLALGERFARLPRRWRNRIAAYRSRFGGRPKVVEELPEPVLIGNADQGGVLVSGVWLTLGREVDLGRGSMWDAPVPERRLESERQAFLWLDDLAARGNRASRERAQAWTLDWIRRYGGGRGPGWQPELAGLRLERWVSHSALLTKDLDKKSRDRFWRALAGQQRYLLRRWRRADEGLPRLRALAGLVWSGVVLPHSGHAAAVEELGRSADALINENGETASRRPEELAEYVTLLIWTARVLENAGQHAPVAHLSAIVRAVPVLRQLRLGDGSMAAFNGGGRGSADALDQALAELRIGVQDKPKLAMGYARLSGGRIAVVMDADEPVKGRHAVTSAAGTLGLEMSAHRHRLVVNAGPGQVFGRKWGLMARQTAAHSTVEVGGRSSARIVARGLAASTFGPRLTIGPSLVSIRQAQDATGQWLLATHDGYVSSFGVLHERRLFIDMRGTEVRGEDILSVPDARAKAQHDRAARNGPVQFCSRFHLDPAVEVEIDASRDHVLLTLPDGEMWVFRATGGEIELEETIVFDPQANGPIVSMQVVVRSELVEYLGQIIWSFGRISDQERLSDMAP